MTRADLKEKIRLGEPVTGISEALITELTEDLMAGDHRRDAEPVTLQESAGSPHARLLAAAGGRPATLTEQMSRSRVKDGALGPEPTKTVADGLRWVAARSGPTRQEGPPPRRERFVYDPADVTLTEAQLATARARMRGEQPVALPPDAHARLIAACTR